MVCPIPVATLEDSCALYLCICSIQKSNHSLQSKSSSVYNILEVQDQCENFIHTLSGPKVLSGVLCFRTTFMIKSSCPPSPLACWQKFIVWGETEEHIIVTNFVFLHKVAVRENETYCESNSYTTLPGNASLREWRRSISDVPFDLGLINLWTWEFFHPES